jgi:phosphonate dehydrogenase
VVLALPLLGSTKYIIDAGAVAAMKRGVLLINPARGSLVNESAVADAISNGHLRGYAADVFECEDWARTDRPAIIDERLVAAVGKTVLTPHIGSAVIDVRREIEASAARSIVEALQGHIPTFAINLPRD